jgi:hypothetical protein
MKVAEVPGSSDPGMTAIRARWKNSRSSDGTAPAITA